MGDDGGELAHGRELLLAHELVLRGAELVVGTGEIVRARVELRGLLLELLAQAPEARDEVHHHGVDEDRVPVRHERGPVRRAERAKDVVGGGGAEEDPAAEDEHAAAPAGVGVPEREHDDERGCDAARGGDPAEQRHGRGGAIDLDPEHARRVEVARAVDAEQADRAGDRQGRRDAVEDRDPRAGMRELGVPKDEVDEEHRRGDPPRVARGEGARGLAESRIRRGEPDVEEDDGDVEQPEDEEVDVGAAAAIRGDPVHGHGRVCRAEREEESCGG